MIGHPRRRTYSLLSVVACLIAGLPDALSAEEPARVNVPLVNTDGGVGLTTAPVSGVDVSAEVIAGEETDGTATSLTFNNPLAERRIAALEGVPAGALEGATVFAFDCTYTGGLGSRSEDPFGTFGSSHPALVALFLESDGGSWYQMINRFEWDPFAWQEIRIPLKGRFARAHFATDSDEAIRWEQVVRVWVGSGERRAAERHAPGQANEIHR